jgi:hypothetical protein
MSPKGASDDSALSVAAMSARRLGSPVSSSVRESRSASAVPWASRSAIIRRATVATRVTSAGIVTNHPMMPVG